MPHCEWINCLTGARGNSASFPEEIVASNGIPCAVLRISSLDGNVEICPHFRSSGDTFLNGEKLLVPTALPAGVPVNLRSGRTLLALCVGGNADEAADDVVSGENWAREYRFPLWTIFDAGTLDAVETVARPADIPAALARNALSEDECLLAPYGLPLVIPATHLAGVLF